MLLSAQPISGGVKLTWTPYTGGGLSQYKLIKNSALGLSSIGINIPSNITTYTDTICGPYNYQIVPLNSSGFPLANYNPVSAYNFNCNLPTFNLKASLNNTTNQITFTWDNPPVSGNIYAFAYPGDGSFNAVIDLGVQITNSGNNFTFPAYGNNNYRIIIVDPNSKQIVSYSNQVNVNSNPPSPNPPSPKSSNDWEKYLPYFVIGITVLIVVMIVLIASRKR